MNTVRYIIYDVKDLESSRECIVDGVALNHIAQLISNPSRVLGPCSCELPKDLFALLNSLDLDVTLIRSLSCEAKMITALEFKGSPEVLVMLALSWLDSWGEKV